MEQININIGNVFERINGMINGFFRLLPNIVIGLIVFLLFYILARVARNWIRRFTGESKSANLGMVLGRLTQAGVVLVGALVALTIIAPSVQPADLLGALGIGGIAIGFAFRDILQNLLAGILILLREPFKIGDQIVVGEYEGTVEDIETRATLLRTYDGRRVVIPNGDIYTDSVVVNTAFANRRSQYDIGIGYGDDVQQAVEIILNTVREIDGVLEDPAPDVLVVELAGSTVNLRARWWTNSQRKDVVQVNSRAIAAIQEALDEAGVDMPFPTQVVLWHDQTEETDGDRTRQREGWPAGAHPPAPKTIARSVHQLDLASDSN